MTRRKKNSRARRPGRRFRPPAWRRYEKQIHEKLRAVVDPGTSVSFDRRGTLRLLGRFSRVPRQVVDCKCINRRINVRDVETFAGLVLDVEATTGLLVTKHGFSAAAQNRISQWPIRLQIVPLDELETWIRRMATTAHTVGAMGTMTYSKRGKIVTEWVGLDVIRRVEERRNGLSKTRRRPR